MSKFKVGDYVIATKGMAGYFETGAKGKVSEVDSNSYLVAFSDGEYLKYEGYYSKGGEWWASGAQLELVKDTNTQSGDGYAKTLQAVEEGRKIMQEGYGNFIEGDGYAIQAWAVEIDGEISPWQTYPSRKIAREERDYFESFGHKAHVRKIEIRKVKGKV